MSEIDEQIHNLTNEIHHLKNILKEKEEELKVLTVQKNVTSSTDDSATLSKIDVVRYSRQMIIPQVSVQGQLRLKQLSVLIVGAGGLGCPAALYLAGAGVGRIGIVDYDVVEENNLHRQLLHSEEHLGKPKVDSAAIALKKLNSSLVVDRHQLQLSSTNALELVKQYDVVVDASDNVATRYLVNDACVMSARPLVSGSALQLEGQLTVYNHADGPCYRCLYPTPPPAHTVTNCSDAGVLGPVPGVIGTLQALEVIKTGLGMPDVLSSRLLLFDGESCSFRTIKLRPKSADCVVCGNNPSVTQLIDYEQFCGAAANDKDKHLRILSEDERLSAEDLSSMLGSESPCVVVDVRQELEYQMCSIPGSVNIPLTSLGKQVENIEKLAKGPRPLVCMVCRRGNDSQLAVKKLQPLLSNDSIVVKDLKGGLHAWARSIDPQFPIY